MNDAEDRGTGSNRNVFAFVDDGEKGVGGLRFCADHAAEGFAKAAISAAGAGDAVGVGVQGAGGGGWDGIRMVAERVYGLAE